jgi:hypothetical protein
MNLKEYGVLNAKGMHMDEEASYPGTNSQKGGRSDGPCPYCGNSDVATGVQLVQTGHVGLSLGFAYKAAAIFTGAEMLRGDICRICGTVLRFFVKEPGRNWIEQ